MKNIEKNFTYTQYIIHENKWILLLGSTCLLLGFGLSLWVLAFPEEPGILLAISVSIFFWVSGIGTLLYYLNRKIIVCQNTVIYQTMWRRKRQYNINDLRLNDKARTTTLLPYDYREYYITTKDGEKVFQMNTGMVHSKELITQLKKLQMERLHNSISGAVFSPDDN